MIAATLRYFRHLMIADAADVDYYATFFAAMPRFADTTPCLLMIFAYAAAIRHYARYASSLRYVIDD